MHDAVTDNAQELHPCVLAAVVLVAGTQQTSIVVLLTLSPWTTDRQSAFCMALVRHVVYGGLMQMMQMAEEHEQIRMRDLDSTQHETIEVDGCINCFCSPG